jgi:hypothetical protein
MPNPSTMTKPCVICGEDCAGKPRVKDKLGRYFHEHCYEKALAQRKRGQSSDTDTRPAPRPNPAAHVTHPPAIELNTQADPELLAELLESGGAPQAGSPLHNCPECGKRLDENATLCTNCGFNLTQGGRLKTEKGEVTVLPHQALRTDEDDPTRLKPILDEAIESTAFTGYTPPTVKTAKSNTNWPYVIGGISILLGLGATCLYGFSVYTAATQALQDGGAAVMVNASLSILWTLLGIWLMWCGISLIQRNPTVLSKFRSWAVTQLVLQGTCLGLAFGVFGLLRDEVPAEIKQEIGPILDIITVLLAGMLVTQVGWPLFCFIWMGRINIKREVNAW